MQDSLNTATRTYGTHYMAEILELSPGEVFDRHEGYRNWTVRDAAALAIYCGLSLSDLTQPAFGPLHNLMN